MCGSSSKLGVVSLHGNPLANSTIATRLDYLSLAQTRVPFRRSREALPILQARSRVDRCRQATRERWTPPMFQLLGVSRLTSLAVTFRQWSPVGLCTNGSFSVNVAGVPFSHITSLLRNKK